jgi:hypothetical protein
MKIVITKTDYWHDFTCDGIEGTIRFEEARQHTQTFKPIREHFNVTIANGRAWREIDVFGTKSMRNAIKAAAPHFKPLPEIRMMGGQEIFGETRTVKIPKQKKKPNAHDPRQAP